MKQLLVISTAILFGFTSCYEAKKVGSAVTDALTTPAAEIKLMSTADATKEIGEGKFYAENDGSIRLVLNINMPSRADSNVAVHIHEHGDCGDKGNMAHGHWNPTNENHGKWGEGQYHSGDIGNIKLNAFGVGTITLTTNRWSTSNATNNIIGKSIIVHGGTDDFVSQPTGNSGPRVGCGVIVKGS